MKDRIKLIMESQNMTQQIFAQSIGISPATLSSIFNGRTQPTFKIVNAIKNAIPRISTDWLLFGKGDMFESDASGSDGLSATLPHNGNEPVLDFDAPSAQPVQMHLPPQGLQEAEKGGGKRAIEDMKIIDKEERKITHICIFYDDQTWQTFVPEK